MPLGENAMERQFGLFVSPDRIKRASLDFIVRVDRRMRADYPKRMKRLLHPELECRGPSEYDLLQTRLWLHDVQERGNLVTAEDIYYDLKDRGRLETCLGQHDAQAIMNKGHIVFFRLFRKRTIYLYKSAAKFIDGQSYVPCLCLTGRRITHRWDLMKFHLDRSEPALVY